MRLNTKSARIVTFRDALWNIKVGEEYVLSLWGNEDFNKEGVSGSSLRMDLVYPNKSYNNIDLIDTLNKKVSVPATRVITMADLEY